MGWFGSDNSGQDQQQAYDQYQQSDNKASLSHELIAGAASYEAAKAYENHCDKNGNPGSHQEAKEILAGFTGAFVDREAETRGADMWDREKLKRDATQQAQDGLQQNNQSGW